MSADDKYEQENDMASGDVPAGDPIDNDYVSRPGQSEVPVVKDDAAVEEPTETAEPDSDEALRRDDTEAIDQSNIISGRTRGAGPSGGYREPGDEEGLPANDGTSSNS
ncbi:hypothetical protein N7G274_003440 [Stereocaulon virgatum]|uniref:Histone chaperone domain-containing protein n=1 Tax=Stereocaulon virgatum TaxID=373712 RepID=A0ABR4AFL2_9LECA